MKIRLLPALAMLSIPLGLPPATKVAHAQDNPASRSVVKVQATQRRPDTNRPWTHLPQHDFNGSGVVIEGHRILTNAQIVKYASRVLVEADHAGEKYAATVEFLADDLDLALLRVEEPGFFDRHPPLPRHDRLPRLKDSVVACGYPQGGENLAFTRGIVSRIEFEEYYYLTMGLRIQVDAAINPGNSGGPALVDDKMIGIIFNRLDESDNIGYIIPNEEIDLFLADVADGTYDGKPQIVDVFQTPENQALRVDLGLPRDVQGLLCRRPARDDPSYPLRPRDVITALGDHPIDAAGKAKLGDDLRVDARYYVQKLARGGKLPVTVFRDGKPTSLDLPVPHGQARTKVLPNLMGRSPSYLVWGPLAFAAASEDYLDAFDREELAPRWYPYMTYNRNPMLTRRGDQPRFDGEQLVVAVALFPHRTSKGYTDPSTCVVESVDGVPVKNLRHLAALLREPKPGRVAIAFHDRNSELFIFDRKEIEACAEEILNENGIRKPASDDLLDVRQAARAPE